MSQVALITQSGVVSFNTKSGVAEITAEGALFKGGAALSALKDAAVEIALSKAVNGKYRAACDILAAAFPAQHKAFDRCHGVLPWANKETMLNYVSAMENAKQGKSGEWSKKQVVARALLAALRSVPAFKREAAEAVTLEAEAA